MKKLLKSGLFVFGFLLLLQTVLAASCTVNGEEVPCGSFPWWIFIVFFVVGIAFFIFWVKMIIHAAKSDNPNKLVWILIIVLTGLIGAIIYYFVVKRNE
jgi:hypothetical protein